MTLGSLIRILETCPNKEFNVYFDFGNFSPDQVESYRGFYDQLAIGFSEGNTKVSELLFWLKDAVGGIFTGYKGGEFLMDEDTKMWVANYGESNSTAVDSVEILTWAVIIRTRWEEI